MIFGQKQKKVGEGSASPSPVKVTGPDASAILSRAKATLSGLEASEAKAKAQESKPKRRFKLSDYCSC